MAFTVPSLSALTATLSVLALVLSALAFFRPESRFTSLRKQLRSLELEIAALTSSMDSVITTVKRLSSREGMRELRSKRTADSADAPPPPGTPKEQLRRRFLTGRTHAEIATLVTRGGIDNGK